MEWWNFRNFADENINEKDNNKGWFWDVGCFVIVRLVEKEIVTLKINDMAYRLKKDGNLILSSEEVPYKALNGFVYETFKYFSNNGMGDATLSFMQVYDQPGINESIGNSKRYSLKFDDKEGKEIKLAGIFFEGSPDEVDKYNKRHQSKNPNQKRYRDESTLKINGKDLYISNEWNISGENGLTFKKFQKLIKECYPTYSVEDDEESFNKDKKLLLQKIYYGAPGTGKSYGIKNDVGIDKNDGKKMRTDNNIRVTFHPDSDYASFVGCYKPTVDDKQQILYKFVPQTFAKAYVEAWKRYLKLQEETSNPSVEDLKENQFYLVIEEINRGNCAQIFGDIFQLLDRNKEGFSEYGIDVDADLANYLKKEFENDDFSGVDDGQNIKSGTKMYLPPTLSLLATMNTSDQSLFPMDSAFKRRWNWKYVPIKDEGKDWKIEGVDLSWWEFLKKINTKIVDVTGSTDKQMGYYFVKPDMEDEKTISKELFVDKVIFYLWNDVFKRYGKNDDYNIVNFYKEEKINFNKVKTILEELPEEVENDETKNA